MEENSVNTRVYSKTFLWMFLGLLATGVISVFTYSTDILFNIVSSGAWPVILIVELVVVILFSFLYKKLPAIVVSILYFVYAVINGFSMATIFYVFELKSIIYIFFAAAAIFGLTAFYGYITKKDLSKIGTILIITLIVCVVISLINLFIGASYLDMIIDWIVLLAFFGITAWDMQKVKLVASNANGMSVEDENKLAINCAMELYLDFINIFIRLLNFFGKRK